MKKYKIAVAGTGYVGLSIATLLSQHHHVTAVDVLPEKVALINARKSPIRDDYIEKYLAEKELDLTATLNAKAAYADADFVVIAAPTNYDSQTQHFDTSAFRILIAEDDPSTARLLCAIVKRAGYEPLIAADGVQALELLDHNQIDLLLCDVMMPRMDGFALTKAIRESGSMLPILMLTAKDMPQDKHTGFIVGTDDYMTKPPDRQELVLRIKALLRRARIVDEHRITIAARVSANHPR